MSVGAGLLGAELEAELDAPDDDDTELSGAVLAGADTDAESLTGALAPDEPSGVDELATAALTDALGAGEESSGCSVVTICCS